MFCSRRPEKPFCITRKKSCRRWPPRALVALPLGKRKLRRQWGILHWRGRRLSFIEETFLRLCRADTVRLAA